MLWLFFPLIWVITWGLLDFWAWLIVLGYAVNIIVYAMWQPEGPQLKPRIKELRAEPGTPTSAHDPLFMACFTAERPLLDDARLTCKRATQATASARPSAATVRRPGACSPTRRTSPAT